MYCSRWDSLHYHVHINVETVPLIKDCSICSNDIHNSYGEQTVCLEQPTERNGCRYETDGVTRRKKTRHRLRLVLLCTKRTKCLIGLVCNFQIDENELLNSNFAHRLFGEFFIQQPDMVDIDSDTIDLYRPTCTKSRFVNILPSKF